MNNSKITNTNLSYFKDLNFNNNNETEVGDPSQLTNQEKASGNIYNNDNRNFLMPDAGEKITTTEAFYQYQFFIATVAIVYFGSKYFQNFAKMPNRKNSQQDFQDFIGTIVLATIWFSVGGLKKRQFLSFNSSSFIIFLGGLLLGAGYPVYNYYALKQNYANTLHIVEYIVMGIVGVLALTLVVSMNEQQEGTGTKYLVYVITLVAFYYLFVLSQKYNITNPPSVNVQNVKGVLDNTDKINIICPSQKTQEITAGLLGGALLLLIGKHYYNSHTGLNELLSFQADNILVLLVLGALATGLVIGFKMQKTYIAPGDPSIKKECPNPQNKYVIYGSLMGAIVLLSLYFGSSGDSFMPEIMSKNGIINLIIAGLIIAATYYLFKTDIDKEVVKIEKDITGNLSINAKTEEQMTPLKKGLLIGFMSLSGLVIVSEVIVYFIKGEFIYRDLAQFLIIFAAIGMISATTLIHESFYTKSGNNVDNEIIDENKKSIDNRYKYIGGINGIYLIIIGVVLYLKSDENKVTMRTIKILLSGVVEIITLLIIHNNPLKDPRVDNFEGTLKLRLPIPAKPENPKIKQMETQINNLQQLVQQKHDEPSVTLQNQKDLQDSQDTILSLIEKQLLDGELDLVAVGDDGAPIKQPMMGTTTPTQSSGNQETDVNQENKIQNMLVDNFGFLSWYLTLFLIKDTGNSNVEKIITFITGLLVGGYVSNFSYYGINPQ